MPKNACEMFWANWTSCDWLALTVPRQRMPRMKPSDSAVGAISSGRRFVRGFFLNQRAIEPTSDLLAAAGDEASAGVIIPQQIVPEGEPMFGVGDVIGQQLA